MMVGAELVGVCVTRHQDGERQILVGTSGHELWIMPTVVLAQGEHQAEAAWRATQAIAPESSFLTFRRLASLAATSDSEGSVLHIFQTTPEEDLPDLDGSYRWLSYQLAAPRLPAPWPAALARLD